MKTKNKWLQKLLHGFGMPADKNPDVRESGFFFLLVTLVLAGVAFATVRGSELMQSPARWIPFVMLMVVHIALFWVSPYFADTLRRTVGYLVVQATLVFILTQFTRDLSAIIALYPPLLGIAVGMLHERRRVVLTVAIWLGLATLNLLVNLGVAALATWLMAALPLTLFVVVYVVLYLRQVEARDRAQTLLRELETAHRELAEYAAQVEDLTLAAERQRMARELHDTLAQGVAGLILQLEAADSHLVAGRAERAQGIVQQAMARARATLAEARQAIRDLRESPGAAPDLGTVLRAEAERFTGATGIPCDFDVRIPARLPDTLCEHVLRIVAEGLVNVARHARAHRVWLTAIADDGWLDIEVRDDGEGFDRAAVAAEPGHYGLVGMRERARLAGGTLSIESAPGAGTRLGLRFPL